MCDLRMIFIALLFSGSCYAQPIDGKWVGNYNGNFFSASTDKLVVELFLHDDSLVSGASHLYYGKQGYEHYRVTGVYHKADSIIYFKEDSTISVKLSMFASNVLGSYTMKLKVNDTVMRLEGKWKENSTSFFAMSSKVWLEKPLKKTRTDSSSKAPIVKVKDKNLQRPPNVQSLIEIKPAESDSIKIEVNDNAQIDGDVVSVYMDDNLIISKQKIVKEPIVFYVSVRKDNPICRLTIAAESEGTTPPCTAHMVVTTKQKRYELDLSSDTRKSGTLELFLKE